MLSGNKRAVPLPAAPGASQGESKPPDAGSGIACQTSSTRSRREKLRAMPTVGIHPLRRYLEDRGVGIAEGAKLLGVSERALREVLAWRTRFAFWRERV